MLHGDLSSSDIPKPSMSLSLTALSVSLREDSSCSRFWQCARNFSSVLTSVLLAMTQKVAFLLKLLMARSSA